MSQLCEYGCGQEATYQFKNGKWCCSKRHNLCPEITKKIGQGNKGKIVSKTTKEKISKGMTGIRPSEETRRSCR